MRFTRGVFVSVALSVLLPTSLFAQTPSFAAAPTGSSTPAPSAEQTAFYNSVADAYMQGKWNDLDALLKDSASLAKLNKDQSADINYIRQALLECRPAWWASAKSGKATILAITVSLWKKTFPVHYSASSTPHLDISTNEFGNEYDLQFSTAKLEATDPAGDLGNTNAGDAQKVSLWQSLAVITVRIESDPLMKSRPATDLIANITRYGHFREAVTSGYYGSPGARRRTMIQCLEALSPDKNDNEEALGWRAVGSALLAELIAHHDRYPSIAWPADPLPSTGAQANEAATAKLVGDQLGDIKFTVAEDKALRNFFKDLADANPDVKTAMTTGIVKLPNSQTYALDPKKDEALAAKRYHALASQSSFMAILAKSEPSKVDAASGQPGAVPTPASITFYKDTLDAYMKGDWDKLEKVTLKDKVSIARLTKDQQADIAYIKDALAECHPAWWDKMKAGKPMVLDINLPLWKRSYSAQFRAADSPVVLYNAAAPLACTVQWPSELIESGAPDPELRDFTMGDSLGCAVWRVLGSAAATLDVRPLLSPQTPQPQRANADAYILFRESLTAIYYGTPRVRQRMLVLCMSMCDELNTQRQPTFLPWRATAAAIFADVISQLDRYPTFEATPNTIRPSSVVDIEGFNLEQFGGSFFGAKFTFDEDRRFRDAIKKLCAANENVKDILTTGIIHLPNGQVFSLDPSQDGPLEKKRYEWQVETSRKIAPVRALPAGSYADEIKLYMSGDWDTLERMLKSPDDPTKLSPEQKADIAYIREALAECYPEWWKVAHRGDGSLDINLPLWNRRFPVDFKSNANAMVDFKPDPDGLRIQVYWPVIYMEQKSPLPSPAGFEVRDKTSNEIWGLLGQASARLDFDGLLQAKPPADQVSKYNQYVGLRQSMAAIYYGSPRARQLAIYKAIQSEGSDARKALTSSAPARAIAAAIVADLISHPERYPTTQWPHAQFPPYEAQTSNEFYNSTVFGPQFLSATFTFAEDRNFRAIIKDLAAANSDYKQIMATGIIRLPNGQTFSLVSRDDRALAQKRYEWEVANTARLNAPPGASSPPAPVPSAR